MKFKKCILLCLPVALLLTAIAMVMPAHSAAIKTLTGGDGYIPFTYNGRIYNIFHHQSVSGNPASPIYDLNCTLSSGQDCPTFPHYFSSTNGASGSLSTGTAGPADIYTSLMPNATIVGSKLYYAAQRASDNGIGCFDLDTNVNCGYFQLGTLPMRTGSNGLGAVWPSEVDGVEQIGTKLYSFGDDLKMYCLDITNPGAPVACTSQPYAINTGITAQLPVSDQSTASRLIHDGKIYISVNYSQNTPAADAQVTCFDPALNDRCSGWTSIDIPGTSNSITYTLFDYPDTNGTVNSFCNAVHSSEPVQCWDYSSQLSVPPPPGLFTGITTNLPVLVRNVLRVGNKSYFALEEQGYTTQDSLGVCYDFSVQTRCPDFGNGGVKRWNGADGDIAVNSGHTREYGYAMYSSKCLLGLGDTGVLWSFNTITGRTSINLDCADDVAAASVPAAPDTGQHTDSSRWAIVSILLLLCGGFGLRYTYKTYR